MFNPVYARACVLLCMCVMVKQAQTADLLQCYEKEIGMQVTIRHHRNQTGHIISQVALESANDDKILSQKKYRPWTVDVTQKAKSCEEDVTKFVITFTASPKLGPDYELYAGVGYYKLHPVMRNWKAAREICAEEGAHLVIINSEIEAAILKTLYVQSGLPIEKRWAWTGIYEQGNNGYFTLFGDSLNSTGFTRWVSSQPDDPGKSDCLVYNSVHDGLEDTPCVNSFVFVCEHEFW